MFSAIINYHGLDFEVSGDWIPYRPAKPTADPYYSQPPEGEYFDSYEILIDGKPVDDILDDRAIDEILGIAERLVMEQGSMVCSRNRVSW